MSVRTSTPFAARRTRRALPTLLVAGLVTAGLLAPGTASAGGKTLKRAVGNIVQAPIDLALAPVTAGIVEYRNLQKIDDALATKIAYTVPGYVWLTGIHAGASTLRAVTGVLELVPGMAMLFTDSELEPMFAPADTSRAVLLDRDTPVMELRLGVDYTGIDY